MNIVSSSVCLLMAGLPAMDFDQGGVEGGGQPETLHEKHLG